MTDSEDTPEFNSADFMPGTHGCHEALHMALFFAEQVDQQLCEHPAIQLQPEWHKLAEEAFDKLHDLYRAIGREHLPGAPSLRSKVDGCPNGLASLREELPLRIMGTLFETFENCGDTTCASD